MINGQATVKLPPAPPDHQGLWNVTNPLLEEVDLGGVREGTLFLELNERWGDVLLAVKDKGGRGGGDPGEFEICGPAVSVKIFRGQLIGQRKEDPVSIFLQRRRAGQMKPLGGLSCTVTWFAKKEEAVEESEEKGASHRCAERKGEISVVRKTALDGALEGLGIREDLEELLASDQVTGKGSSALRVYTSFIQPKPGGKHDAVDNMLEAVALRAAQQIGFFLRAYRAEQAEYLRNKDAALEAVEALGLPTHPLVLILDNVRSAYNVGSIFRTAETAKVAEVITCGFTPHPPHPKLEKTAFSAVLNVPSRHFNRTIDGIMELKEKGYQVWAMETTAKSEIYTNVSYPQPVAIILGNEVIGVDTEVMALCDKVIEIPTFGVKNSLNVASACPVVVFEVLRQWRAFPSVPKEGGDRETAQSGEP